MGEREERRWKTKENVQRREVSENTFLPLHFSDNYKTAIAVVFVSHILCRFIISLKKLFNFDTHFKNFVF